MAPAFADLLARVISSTQRREARITPDLQAELLPLGITSAAPLGLANDHRALLPTAGSPWAIV